MTESPQEDGSQMPSVQEGDVPPSVDETPAATFARPHRGTLLIALGAGSIVLALACCITQFVVAQGQWYAADSIHLGILCACLGAVALILGAATWYLARADVAGMEAGQMDAAGHGQTAAGQTCGLVGGAIILLTVATLMVLWVAGVSEGGARQAGNNIHRALARSQRLYQRAQALMSISVYEKIPENKPGPFTQPVGLKGPDTSDQLKLHPPGVVNPKALDALQKAADELKAALDDNPTARENIRAVAARLRSKVLSLTGRYHVRKSLVDRAAAREALGQAQSMIAVMREQTTFLTQYDKLMAMKDDDVEKLLDQARRDDQTHVARHGEVSQEIIDTDAQINAMRSQIADRAEKAREARSQSRLAKGQAGMDLLEQALKYEAEIGQLSAKVSIAQDRVRQLVGQRRILGVQINAARRTITAASAILDHRKTQKGKRYEERQRCMALIAESARSVTTLTVTIVALCEKAKAEEKLAIAAYQAADAQLGQSRVSAEMRSAEAMADKADLSMRAASLRSERYSLHGRLMMLKEWIEELWPKVFPDKPIPEEAKKLTEYVPSPETLKTLALQGYTTAISNYDGAAQALGKGEQKYRWFYQGQQAAACLAHWQLQPDPNQLKRAEDILNAALKDKEASPYLRPVVRLRDMLKTGRSPEREPVPEEPATTAPADTSN